MNAYQTMFSILDYRVVSYFTEICIELGVFEQLTTNPMNIETLADKTQTHPGALRQCLRGLSHFGLFEQQQPDTFGLTETSRYLTEQSEFSLLPWNSFCQQAQSAKHQKRREMWKALLRSGQSMYQLGRNQLFYDYLRENQTLASAFDKGMSSMSMFEITDILQGFDFSASTALTEVAGGSGRLITGILEQQPQLQGQLFDFPDVVERSQPHPRLNSKGINMHEALPEIPGDAIMKRILHSYSDSNAINILKNVAKAMTQSKAKLHIFELIEDQHQQNPYVGIKSLQMLLVHGAAMNSAGPGERTLSEFIHLLDKAGFELHQTTQLNAIDAITAIKR